MLESTLIKSFESVISIKIVESWVTSSKYFDFLILYGLSNSILEGIFNGITIFPSYYFIIGICKRNVCSISLVNVPISPVNILYDVCYPNRSSLND
jgi:hypothetical protein